MEIVNVQPVVRTALAAAPAVDGQCVLCMRPFLRTPTPSGLLVAHRPCGALLHAHCVAAYHEQAKAGKGARCPHCDAAWDGAHTAAVDVWSCECPDPARP